MTSNPLCRSFPRPLVHGLAKPMVHAMASLLILLASAGTTLGQGDSPAKPLKAKESKAQTWTVDRLRTEVEASIKRFETVSLEATYTHVRNVNRFSGKEPLLMNAAGSVVYRGDGERWYMRDDGYSFRAGIAKPTPSVSITGNTGKLHYTGNQRKLTLAEKGSRRRGRPRSIFWEPILTYTYLETALSQDDAEITFVGQDDGVSVVELTSAWGSDDNRWSLVVRFDIERSLMPLTQKLDYNGKLYADSKASQFARDALTGLAYPSIVETKYHQEALGIVEQTFAIAKLELPESHKAEAFDYQARLGADIVDRRSNLAWHEDPWWETMMPWLIKELGFPRYSYQYLKGFSSTGDVSIDGQDAPPIEASGWLGQPREGWDRPGRRFSVLFFWGDASYIGTPGNYWITELGQLHSLIEPFGGEVIGIASHRTSADALRKTADELMIQIPFAIDVKDDDYGMTHSAYKLNHYYSVLVVDDAGKVLVLDKNDQQPLLSAIGKVLPKDEMEALLSVIHTDPAMTRAEHDAIQSHWIKKRKATQGASRIEGNVGKPGATLTLRPQMKMLIATTPGAYMLFYDRQGVIRLQADEVTGDYSFDDLPRGLYELSVRVPTGEKDQTSITIPDDETVHVHSFWPAKD